MAHAPYRLALVITELEVGGAERCLSNLARHIDRSRYEPQIYSLAPRPRSPRDELVKLLEAENIRVEFLGVTRKQQLWSAVKRMREAWIRQPPDVVQSMLFHANVVTALAARGTGHLSRWCSGIRVADPARIRQFTERIALRPAARVVCVSQQVASFAQTRLHVPEEKLEVIPNGIDVQVWQAATPASLESLGVKPGHRAITCISRLAAQKGIDDLLRMAPRLLQELPRHDLLLVGDGAEAGPLKSLAARLGLGSRVHFCGWQSNIPGILKASDLLVLPSRWEGMPNVLLEAMACQRPVVCNQVEGVQEVLGPLSDAQSVATGDSQAFAEKVLTITQDDSIAAHLGEANRRRIESCFSLPAMIERYEELFDEVSAAV